MIKDKRDSLERFIREQTIGPGINGYRYVDLSNNVLTSNKLSDLLPIDYSNEIIDIVPAAVYSTGILFPEEIKNQEGYFSADNNPDNNEIVTEEEDSEENDSQDSSLPTIEEADGIQIDQMYPKTMGFTCCLDNRFIDYNSLKLKLKVRYYRKIKTDRDGDFNSRFGLQCEADREKFESFIKQHELNDFSLKEIGPNSFLLLNRLPSEDITSLKKRIRTIQKQLAEIKFDNASNIVDLPRLTRDSTYLSNLKSTLFYELKNSITNESIRNQVYSITQEIELIENITDHLRNLLDANSGGYGLWQSELVERIVQIENIDFQKDTNKKSLLYYKNDYGEKVRILLPDQTEIGQGLKNIFTNKLENDENGTASLSLNFQFSRDSRKKDNRIFLKVQLVNTSTPYDEGKQDDNRYFSTFNELVNQKCFFGVSLSLENDYLVPYNRFALKKEPEIFDEDITTQFIYRQFEDYGIGHGCSVKWDKISNTIETEYIPYSDTPDIEPIPRNKSRELVAIKDAEGYKDAPFLENTKFQEFKWLSSFSSADDIEIIQGLNEFVDSYGDWIEIKRQEYDHVDSIVRSIAKQELDKCFNDYQRMKDNLIKFLSGNRNKLNLESFRLMNAAMFMQLWHSEKVKHNEVIDLMSSNEFQNFNYEFYKSKADDRLFPPYSESAAWRAFQLAFILLNLDGIFQDESDISWEKRNDWVDLVWFPTGGGKTEAYLGLIALTIINRRRIHGSAGGGTAAIMRYTLRLLTLQQFQRATLLIMALELLRRWRLYNLGEEPIYIGLWVGKDSIPNSVEDLKVEYRKIIDNQENKIPFSNCPWCNSKLRPSSTLDSGESIFNKDRLHLHCDNNKCSFTEPDFFEGNALNGPLPVCLCDNTIYLHPPSLLFGTVDKFAQLAHKVNGTQSGRNSDSRRIFGRGNWEVGKPINGYLPPDLIIQDELHLLLGPLGSAVALFESAINQLCTREDGTRPKVISSTATTRNTELQIAALFDRKVDLFPKQGVECDDSFFAYYKRSYSDEQKTSYNYLSKRRYLGIIPTGRTQIWMQMRLGAILMTHRAMFELQELVNNETIDFSAYEGFEKAMDYYNTTISYFNSLKEVGKTQSQIQSYILKELRRVFARVIRPQKLMHSLYTYGPINEAELTGRLSGEEVKNELKRVQEKWTAKNRFAYIENDITIKGHIPPEYVVATNMISVGIDVSSFNCIIMNSMPRNTAEYIQASSRVARDSHGLVLTIHHPFRARDVSHYEKFIEFHEKMYSYVEPISITPFTKKAVERYLGLFLATMIRHRTQFVERISAAEISKLDETEIAHMVGELVIYFEKRKNRHNEFSVVVQNLLKEENVIIIKNWIEVALHDWLKESNKTLADNKNFVFNNKSARATPSQEQLYVDIEEYEGNIHSKKWQIPMSLRVIEPEAAIKINPI